MADEKVKKGGKDAKKKASAEDKQKGNLSDKASRPKRPPVLEKIYRESCIPALKAKFNYKNVMQVPRLTKIVINTSMKEALQDVKILETAVSELGQISGQKPVMTRAKKSIANFKLRKGQPIGARVTLRGKSMYEFMTKLVNVALPRVRDFKGISGKAFDGCGNYTLGLTEQFIFPEINFDKVQTTYGMNITFVTTAENDEEGKELLKLMGMPFRTA